MTQVFYITSEVCLVDCYILALFIFNFFFYFFRCSDNRKNSNNTMKNSDQVRLYLAQFEFENELWTRRILITSIATATVGAYGEGHINFNSLILSYNLTFYCPCFSCISSANSWVLAKMFKVTLVRI